MTDNSPPSLGDALRDALPMYEAPDSLRAWARAQAIAEMPARRSADVRWGMRRLAYAASLVAAVAVGWTGQRLLGHPAGAPDERSQLVSALVDTHIRSLMADHLTDVLSSDHHTVKPWFAGKVTFAPPVPELQSQGFPLVGGREEFVAGHTAAALVYRRGLHKINLFVWPAAASDSAAPHASYDGYALEHWTDNGLSYWAVSDAAVSELRAFHQAYQAAAKP